MTAATFHRTDRYWWHAAIAGELQRIAELGTAGYSAAGIAGNLRGFTVTDTAKYMRQMIGWGELVEIEPLWDFPDLWVSLATADTTGGSR